jgi:hypothetical protein
LFLVRNLANRVPSFETVAAFHDAGAARLDLEMVTSAFEASRMHPEGTMCMEAAPFA